MLRTYYLIFMLALIFRKTESVFQKLNVTAGNNVHSEFTGIYKNLDRPKNGRTYYKKSDGTTAYVYFNHQSKWVIGKFLFSETLVNEAVGGKDPPETGWLPLSASIHVKGIGGSSGTTCDASDWPDLYKDTVCGDCKGLVKKMNSKYITCEVYCNKLGRPCTGAWEESGDSCKVKHVKTCDHEFIYTSDAICQCGSSTAEDTENDKGKLDKPTTVASKESDDANQKDGTDKDCSCSDFINAKGYGQCKKGNKKLFGGLMMCYVNMPSTCTDLKESSANKGKWMSAVACNLKKGPESDKSNLVKTTTVANKESEDATQKDGTDCSCSDFINKKGFGQCKKGSSKLFSGSLLCYVNLPSTCTDRMESGTDKGKWISAEACKLKSDVAEIMEITSDGDGYTHQKDRMGKYTKTKGEVQGLPIYEQNNKTLDERQYLFVGPDGYWRVGPDTSTYDGSGLKKTAKSNTPVGTDWEYYEDEDEKWIKNGSIKVIKEGDEPYVWSDDDKLVDTVIFAAGCSGAAAVLEILFCCLCVYCIRKKRSEKKMQVILEMEERNKDVSTNFPHVVLLPGRTLKEDCAAYAADIENLKMEFRLLVRYVERNVPPGLSFSDGMEPDNFDHHNRYKDVLPFNHHRILLSKALGEPATTYINASQVNFYGIQQDFYAAMAPKVNSIQNFWQLIIDKQIGIIVMITALKEGNKVKAAQYWPDKDNANIELPNCKLKYESHTYPGTYFHRKFSLDAGEGPRTVHQLQTNAWKDKTAPSRSKILLDLVYKTQELVKENPGPILVHCSAGVGRTGTFLALYKLADDYSNHNVQVLDIANTVLEMRRQRVKMVQKKEQYVYIAQCLSHYISAQEAEYELIGPPGPPGPPTTGP